MANVTQISLESLLLRVTNPNNPSMDTATLNALFALINKEKDGPAIGVKVIASRLPAGSEKEVLSTLNVLDSCMSRCGTSFQNEVGKFRFLNEMIKLVSPKYLGSRTPLSVKQRVLQLLYLWTLDYPKEVKIKEAFDMLRKQGVIRDIPNPNIPEEALGYECKKRITNSIFQDEEKSNILRKLLQSKDPEDIQAANWLIKSMVKEDEKMSDLKSKTLTELESVQNNIKLLNEMIGSYKDGDTTKNELDLMNELHDNLVRFKPNLKSMADSDKSLSADLLDSVLKTMDDVTDCLSKYSQVCVNPRSQSTKSNLASLLELDQENVGLSADSFIQIDPRMEHFREPKGSSIDDCSCSSYNGSSQTSQVSSITSKSSVDVLCDVFTGLGDESQDTNILKPVAVASSTENIQKDRDKSFNKNLKALEDLDVLGARLINENLPSSNYRGEKIPMNLLTKMNEVKKCQQLQQQVKPNKLDFEYLLDSKSSNSEEENVSQVDSTDDCLVDISEEKPIQKNGDVEILPFIKLESDRIKLKDITLKLEDIRPSSKKSIVALEDRNGLTVLLHKAAESPKPLVTVYVVTTVSKNDMSINDYLFQAVVPKGCKLRLLPPSTTELPAFNPFLPPAAITQIMLLANETNLTDITLKFVISYVMDDDTLTEMGEVNNLPLDIISTS